MKILKLFVLALLTITFSACGSDDDSDSGITAGSGQLTAVVGGQQFTFDNAGGSLDDSAFTLGASRENADGDLEILSIITLNSSEGTFEFDLSNGNATYAIGTDVLFSTLFDGGSGQITITNLDAENNTASGSFEFDAVRILTSGNTETIQIREGSFTDLPLQ